MKRIILPLFVLALMSTCFCSCKKTHSPLVIAHRGGASMGIENSLSCIEKGIQTGSDMIEIDVHLSSDKQVVVCHDYTLDRTTTGKGNIQDYTLAELRSMRLLNKEGHPTSELIPTLENVLDLCKNRCPVLLEIKKRTGYNDGIEFLCDSIVKAKRMTKQVVFQSFNAESMLILHQINPGLRTELLLGEHLEEDLPTDSAFKAFLDEHYPHIASINVHYTMATPEYIQRVHNAGREIKIWTLDDPAMAPAGVDAIITNCPDKYLHPEQATDPAPAQESASPVATIVPQTEIPVTGEQFIFNFYKYLFSEDYDVEGTQHLISDNLKHDFAEIARWEDEKGYVALDADPYLLTQDYPRQEWLKTLRVVPAGQENLYNVIIHGDTVVITLKPTEGSYQIDDLNPWGTSIHQMAKQLDWNIKPNE